jgi:DNA/RNA-binding domain of Phe-tRNA-synthetase-like protein
MTAIPFQYHPAIRADFKNLAGAAMLGTGLSNRPSSPQLVEVYSQEQNRVKTGIGSTPLSELPTLAGWRSAFRQFGVDPTQYRCAAEALLRRLTKKGDIPSINSLVDCCNLISIRYALPVAAIDLRQVQGVITVHYADGSEHFNPLGEDQPGPPEPGEVIFSDEAGLVVARRWCWRQSVESASQLETDRILVTIEAQDSSGAANLDTAMQELRDLLSQFTGGEYLWARIA